MPRRNFRWTGGSLAALLAVGLMAAGLLFVGNPAPADAQTQVECNGGGPYTVPANWALKPSAITGGTFRLLFISSTSRDANSTAIADYNTHVQTAAKAGHSAITDSCGNLFKVVGSTETVDARDNTATTGAGEPIYWLNGSKVADNYADFYDGSWDNESANDYRNENGGVRTITDAARPFTGTVQGGTKSTSSLGASGRATVRIGNPGGSGGPIDGQVNGTKATGRPFYGLSPVFQVAPPPNTAPTVANAIPNQTATAGTAFSYTFPANTFSDADSDSLTYTATTPSWLSFAANTRTFSGSPQTSHIGVHTVTVTADDGNGGTVTDTFTVTVSAADAQTAVRAPSLAVSAPGVLVMYTAKGGMDPACTSNVEYRTPPGSGNADGTVNVTPVGTKKGDHYRFTSAELTAGSSYDFRVRHTAGTNAGCKPHNTWSGWSHPVTFKGKTISNIGAVSVTAKKATGRGDTTGAPLTNNEVQRGTWVALHFKPVSGQAFPHHIMLQACARKNAQDIDWNDCSKDGNLFGSSKQFLIKRGASEHWYWFEVRSADWGNNNTINLRFRAVSSNKYWQWETPIAKCWTRHGAYDPCKRLTLTAKTNVSDSPPDSTPPDQLIEVEGVPQSEQQVTSAFVPDAALVATVTAKADHHPSASAAERLRKIVKGMTGEAGGYTAAQCRETATHYGVLNVWQPWCDEIERRENWGS